MVPIPEAWGRNSPRVRALRRLESGGKVHGQGPLQSVLAFIPLFELIVVLSEIVEEFGVILALRGGLLQQLYGLRVVPAPIVQNAKRFGDVRIVRIGLAGLRDQLISFRLVGRKLAVEQGELTRGGRIIADCRRLLFRTS